MRIDLRQALVPQPVARRLPLSFDASALRADLPGVQEDWWQVHGGPYHDGGWESVSLWAPRGDLREQRRIGGDFAATPALERSLSLRRVLDALPGERNRARLMRLKPGGRILRHSDPLEQVGAGLVRLHVPITTTPDVVFIVAGHRVVMQPGEVWHVDVRFPHEVWNAGSEARVHLVVDVFPAPDLTALLDRSFCVDRGWLTSYFLKHALPRRVRRRFGIGK